MVAIRLEVTRVDRIVNLEAVELREVDVEPLRIDASEHRPVGDDVLPGSHLGLDVEVLEGPEVARANDDLVSVADRGRARRDRVDGRPVRHRDVDAIVESERPRSTGHICAERAGADGSRIAEVAPDWMLYVEWLDRPPVSEDARPRTIATGVTRCAPRSTNDQRLSSGCRAHASAREPSARNEPDRQATEHGAAKRDRAHTVMVASGRPWSNREPRGPKPEDDDQRPRVDLVEEPLRVREVHPNAPVQGRVADRGRVRSSPLRMELAGLEPATSWVR